jgi:hypothetical protein
MRLGLYFEYLTNQRTLFLGMQYKSELEFAVNINADDFSEFADCQIRLNYIENELTLLAVYDDMTTYQYLVDCSPNFIMPSLL